jgi:hypothetical protein
LLASGKTSLRKIEQWRQHPERCDLRVPAMLAAECSHAPAKTCVLRPV